MSTFALVASLQRLSRLYGVQTAFYDVAHHRHQAGAETLLALLQSLGAPVATLEDLPTALRQRQQARWQTPLEPVTVVWDAGNTGSASLQVDVRLPLPMSDCPLVGHVTMEDGSPGVGHASPLRRQWKGTDLPMVEAADIEGVRYVVKRLSSPVPLPQGYHRFTLEMPGGLVESLLVVAPVVTYPGTEGSGRARRRQNVSRGTFRTWGVVLPLYALQTQQSWGSGDFSDLEALVGWLGSLGGSIVGTLPLLPAFLEEPLDPSPYSPVSRLLWNEFYLDVTRSPELPACPPAQDILASASFKKELALLRNSSLVHYRQGMALKRKVLEELARSCVAAPGRLERLQCFLEAHPVVEDYARFRAVGEKQGGPWRSWPLRLRKGNLQDGDCDEGDRHYHAYVQWLAHQQVQALGEGAQEKGVGIYLDLPLGVHSDGYDAWRNQGLFLEGLSVGAPPDTGFPQGQDWGFPPMHPERPREGGYGYFIASLRHHLQHAGVLRIDHVMGLHRLFCIPKGTASSEGVYLRYPAEEFYAILALESHRHQAVIVGEDLGTVPPDVPAAMRRHGLQRMYVAYFQCTPGRHPTAGGHVPLRPVAANTLASINTHDLPPFASFWQGLDILDRQGLGLLSEAAAHKELAARKHLQETLLSFLRHRGLLGHEVTTGLGASDLVEKKPAEVTLAALNSILTFLAASSAHIMLVNLEDLWLETQPQNVPGTSQERPNWRRKARYSLEELSQLPEVVEVLREVNRLRKST